MAKILYVEDHPAQRAILAQMLEMDGFDVDTASDGIKGVEKAISWLPDIILMDLRMPRMDGFEAIQTIRGIEETAQTPIIVISAWAGGAFKKRALESGADEHFTKPVDVNQLISTINTYLKDDVAHSEEPTEEQRDKRRHHFRDNHSTISVAENQEVAYQLLIWEQNPELAATLEHLTKLTHGIIHDLRNRLGILQNYTPQANYCLSLLESLAFLRFKPTLSQKRCRGNPQKPEILVEDLVKFGLGEFEIHINSPKEEGKLSGLRVKGLIDSQMLSQGLWLLFKGIAGCLSVVEISHMASGEKHIIEIEDLGANYTDILRDYGFYITISVPPKVASKLPKEIKLENVLLGNQLALCLLALEKAIFLNSGTISIDNGAFGLLIEIRVPAALTEDKNARNISLDHTEASRKVSKLSKKYRDYEPNIYPLIQGFVSIISRELDNITLENKKGSNNKMREIIYRNCIYAQLLLQNLLWLGAGFEQPNETINIEDILQSVRDIMRSEIRERTYEDDDNDFIEVRLDLQSNLPSVLANSISLQQVFLNLITNALEAMPDNGTLTLRTFQVGSEVCVEIEDTGEGISSENMDRIFDLAFSTKQGQERGTGLHIVKSIMTKLGGRIEVKSERKLGTTFSLYFQSI